MRRLGGTDSLFLAAETPAWHQHVTGLTIVDPSEAPGFDFNTVVRTVKERLPLIEKLTWKLKSVPLELDRAVWVDDPDFDITRHIKRLAVPAPGGPREVASSISPILGSQLDRSMPLWEMWYLDGLVNGRVGIVMKFHHCLLDGAAGGVLAATLLDFEPFPPEAPTPETPPESLDPEPTPSDARLLTDSLLPLATTPLRLARYMGRLARRGIDLGRYSMSPQPKPDMLAILQAPKTSFNARIGPRREVSFSSVALSDVKALRSHFDAKVNDIVLALVSGALRSHLLDLGELPSNSLTAGIPVSTRSEGDTALDNQVSFTTVPIATDVEDPAERVREVLRHTAAAKGVNRVLRQHPIGSISDTAPPFVIGGFVRLAYESRVLSYMPGMMNTIISNVPGPPMALYLGGARLTGIFSASVLLDQMGLNVTLFTFEDRVDFGIHADPDLVDDPWAIADAIPAELAKLMACADLGAPTPVEDAFGLVSH
jgi:diacylglycerol O-acyltransferase